MPKRGATTRRVKLTKGHFINEYVELVSAALTLRYPVPNPIASAIEPKWLGNKQHKEFTHMRYTAATCDPDDFTAENGWTLRQNHYGRDTELLIAVTSCQYHCQES